MGLAVAASVGALLVNGLRGPPEVCDMCGGNGGSKCFVCEGTGMKPGVALQVRDAGQQAQRWRAWPRPPIHNAMPVAVPCP